MSLRGCIANEEIAVKTEEDEAWEDVEKALGWRKRQIVNKMDNAEKERIRNEVLEEVACFLEKEFTFPFGRDTISSFATSIRGLKR
jgi:hypothetical protein